MKNKKIIFMLLLSLAWVSCKNKNGQTVQETAEVAQVQDTSQVQKSVAEQTSDQPLPEDSSVWYDGEIPIVFDYHKDYPITDIRLSELADVSYLPLETNDSVLLRLIGTCRGNEFYFTNDHIIFPDYERIIYIFDRKGKFIRRIERSGGGPEEYRHISSFAVDGPRKELYIQDGDLRKGQMMVYSFEGKFLRSYKTPIREFVFLNDSLMVGCNTLSRSDYPFFLMRKSDGSIVKRLPIKQVDRLNISNAFVSYGRLTTSPQGVMMGSFANDTIFELRKDLTFVPRIIDESDYGTPNAQAYPTIETSRYLMFYILRNFNSKDTAHIKDRYYIYDKKERRIFQMKEHKDNTYWRLLDDYPHVTNWNKAQNPQAAVRVRQVYALMQGKGKHGPAELQKLLETLDEEDNPVLEIMMFHSVEEIK